MFHKKDKEEDVSRNKHTILMCTSMRIYASKIHIPASWPRWVRIERDCFNTTVTSVTMKECTAISGCLRRSI